MNIGRCNAVAQSGPPSSWEKQPSKYSQRLWVLHHYWKARKRPVKRRRVRYPALRNVRKFCSEWHGVSQHRKGWHKLNYPKDLRLSGRRTNSGLACDLSISAGMGSQTVKSRYPSLQQINHKHFGCLSRSWQSHVKTHYLQRADYLRIWTMKNYLSIYWCTEASFSCQWMCGQSA